MIQYLIVQWVFNKVQLTDIMKRPMTECSFNSDTDTDTDTDTETAHMTECGFNSDSLPAAVIVLK